MVESSDVCGAKAGCDRVREKLGSEDDRGREGKVKGRGRGEVQGGRVRKGGVIGEGISGFVEIGDKQEERRYMRRRTSEITKGEGDSTDGGERDE